MAMDTSFLRQLDRFDVVLKKRVLSNYAGQRQSRRFGSGLVFHDFRAYVPGDDFRAIDWKVYARTNDFFVKRFEEDKSMRMHVVIDASASMDFGTKLKKFEYAAMIGLGFSYMALRNNESFEVSTFSEHLNIFKPKKGVSKLMSIFDTLNQIKPKGQSKFRESLLHYKAAIKTKSMVVIISDFLFDPEELRNTLLRFKRSQVTVVQVLDVAERELSIEGDMILTDSETDDTMRTYVSNRLLENYSEELLAHVHKLKKICDTFNVDFLSVSTDTPIFDTFYELLGKSDKVII